MCVEHCVLMGAPFLPHTSHRVLLSSFLGTLLTFISLSSEIPFSVSSWLWWLGRPLTVSHADYLSFLTAFGVFIFTFLGISLYTFISSNNVCASHFFSLNRTSSGISKLTDRPGMWHVWWRLWVEPVEPRRLKCRRSRLMSGLLSPWKRMCPALPWETFWYEIGLFCS